jgi:hypothetical protein
LAREEIAALSNSRGALMTLFIACILIYHFGMAWWWYPIAAVIWAAGVALQLWWTHNETPAPAGTER